MPGTSHFLFCKTVEALLDKAAKLGLQVANHEPVVIDIDLTFRVLAALKPNRLSSPRTCQVLLDGWNTLEEMARTVGLRLDYADFGVREKLPIVYDKLFYGNNLPAVTPNDQSYSPIFSSSEMKSMRAYLRRMWREILDRSGMI